LFAWTEKDVQLRRKDAQDIAYIIKNYEKSLKFMNDHIKKML
tara:strand:+ start:135 stop:260 length:126 start_codon:yes stop_codon:yes gene_type:complete